MRWLMRIIFQVGLYTCRWAVTLTVSMCSLCRNPTSSKALSDKMIPPSILASLQTGSNLARRNMSPDRSACQLYLPVKTASFPFPATIKDLLQLEL
ncbi:hypothetical protein KC360_g18 [Hortaea werneckii]|nr:hypothetical protein KC344_g17 [Hortaea werneckii]KAI7180514.1 hypothetical protein KC360_g18 [Hortaea werneckii]